jgi:hypothetical protein
MEFMFHYGQGKYVKEITAVRNYVKISPAKATLELQHRICTLMYIQSMYGMLFSH